MNGLTAKQIHERSLLVGATVALAFSGRLTWWETDTRVYSGWSQLGSGGSGLMTGWERLMLISGMVLMLLLVAAACWRPDWISARSARSVGLLAAAFAGALFILLLSGRDSGNTIESHSGLLVSSALAGTVSFLWMSLADNPWPKAESEHADEEPTGADQPE